MCRELIRLILEADEPKPAPGCTFLHELQDGESWTLHPQGGVVVTHPDREPVRIHIVNGRRVREPLGLIGAVTLN